MVRVTETEVLNHITNAKLALQTMYLYADSRNTSSFIAYKKFNKKKITQICNFESRFSVLSNSERKQAVTKKIGTQSLVS